MIDDDFLPDRLQFRALGHLLVKAQNTPWAPTLRESALYEMVYERFVGSARRPWLNELSEHGLVKITSDQFRVGDQVGESSNNVCLTAAGTYYAVSRARLFGDSARTPTDDFPDMIVDAPWAIHSYYSPNEDARAPTGDSFIRFDHNQAAYLSAIDSIDAVAYALTSDNEIGASDPEGRDHALEELRAIRHLLEKREGWATKLISVGWGALGYVMSRFADKPIALLADKAWHALQSILGLR